MRKINFVVRLQHWMDSVPGQTFLNYAYSWGASIVILGALFKLTHLSGGDFMLFIGMGTEVVVFFLSAFDRPFDKNEIGKELPHDYETDEEIAARLGLDDDDETEGENFPDDGSDAHVITVANGAHTAEGGVHAGGVVIVGGGAAGANIPGGMPAGVAGMPATGGVAAAGGAGIQPAAGGSVAVADAGAESSETASQPSAVEAARAAIAAATPAGTEPFDQEAKRLAEIIRMANDELLQRAQAVLSPEMEQATQAYIEKLRTLAETFEKVDEQSARLTRDSQEMENLNRTLTAINKTYDLHFQSISKQVGTIEQINDQTRKLALQIEELNGVYGRMIQALTVNMRMNQNPQGTQPEV